MVIFLYGSDGYRIKENVDSVIDAYHKKHKNGVNFYRFDLDPVRGKSRQGGTADHAFQAGRTSNGSDDFDSAVKSVSFFDEIKLIVIKNIFSDKSRSQNIQFLIKYLGLDADKKTVLLFADNKSKKDLQKENKDLFNVLNNKNNLVKETEPLSGVKLSNWVRSKFKENGHDITPAVAGLLIDMVGNDSWTLASEIEKLCNYKTYSEHSDKFVDSDYAHITEKDVSLLVGHKEESSVFDLIDAVGNRDRAKAFEMTYRLINSGHDSHYLLSMFVYHFENLLSVSDFLEKNGSSSAQLVAAKCGLHPFVARKTMGQAGKFQKIDLLNKFSRLADLDIASKNGQVNLEDALYNFVIS